MMTARVAAEELTAAANSFVYPARFIEGISTDPNAATSATAEPEISAKNSEVPIVTILLVQIGVITPEFLSKNRGYVIVGAFVLSALLTPPDVVTQVFLAGPVIVLFEISIIVSKIIMKRKKKREEEREKEWEDDDDDDSD